MKLILLTYVNRSGSTFLANLFSKFPDILVCPEGEVLMNEFLVEPEKRFILDNETRKKLLNIFRNDPKVKWWNFTEADLDQIPEKANNFKIFLFLLSIYKEKTKPAATTILFKAERLIHLFERLMKLETNPDIVYLSIIRDCRGVYASQKATRTPDSGKWMSRNPVRTAIQWNIHIRKAVWLENTNKLKVIKFEDLITNFNFIFPELIRYTGVSNIKTIGNSGDLFGRLPEGHQKIHLNINSDPISGKVFEWKISLNNNEKLILEQISETVLKKLGYYVERSNFSGKAEIIKRYYYVIFYYLIIKKKLKYLFTRIKCKY